MDSKPVRHSELYLESIIFLVEDTLFKVPRSPLENAGIFATIIFTLPAGENRAVEGSDDEHPVKIEGVSKVDFAGFLRQLCSFKFNPLGANKDVPMDEWISVLKLSTMWCFDDMRNLAIRELSMIDPVTQIILARQYKVSKWTYSGHERLVERSEPISVAEAERLGLSTAIRLYQIRDAIAKDSAHDWQSDIWRTFAVELKEMGAVRDLKEVKAARKLKANRF